MLRRSPLGRFVQILAVVALAGLATGAEARTKCYVCAAADTGTRCLENTQPNFSMQRCSLLCFYYTTGTCFCRTYGNLCIESPDGESLERRAPAEDWSRSPQATSRYHLTPATEKALRAKAGDLVTDFLNWPIPSDLRGPGPHVIRGMLSEDTATYPFVGEITFMYRTAVIRYEVDGHPEIVSIDSQLGPGGYGGTVFVERTDGVTEPIEIFD